MLYFVAEDGNGAIALWEADDRVNWPGYEIRMRAARPIAIAVKGNVAPELWEDLTGKAFALNARQGLTEGERMHILLCNTA